MTSFTKLNLTGGRVLVKGTDSQGTTGETVLWANEWNQVNAHLKVDVAQADFDEAVSAFFAPLTEAAEALQAQYEKDNAPDPLSYVTLNEGVEGIAGHAPEVVTLSRDSMVLRALEEGHEDRLVWVGNTLEILEVLPGTEKVNAGGATGDPHANEDDSFSE